ncbi:MAG TPA: ABC transporter permease [Trueperaceae bacterium]|nr:ABC transporter permease [Trueperaceae bacterium]
MTDRAGEVGVLGVEEPAAAVPRAAERGRAARGRLRELWRRFAKHRGAVAGMLTFGLIVLVVVVGPLVYAVDPLKTDIRARNQAPSLEHPFGTDNLGHDLLAQNLAGGRVSLTVGVAAMLISVIVGTVIGQLAGYYRRLDGPLMRLTDMFLALPILPLLLVAVLLFRDSLRAAMGPQAGIFVLIVVIIGITSWMNTARVVRGEVLALKEREFVTAADALGSGANRIMWTHILPNVMSPILVSASLGMASAIITESALSFLGLGFPPDVPTWGRLLYDGRDYLGITPMRVVWPGMFISLTVLSINFMGDGLRDALDPRSRNRV